jgi:hypothetical protein
MLYRLRQLRGGSLALLIALSAPGVAQAPRARTMVVKGFPERAPLVQMNGKAYVEVEALARITNGTITFQGNQLTFSFGTPGASAAADGGDDSARVSKDMLRAGVAVVRAVEEWRTALESTISNSSPVTSEWAAGQRRNVDSQLSLAAAAVAGNPDRSVLALLTNAVNNMQLLSDKYLAMRRSLNYIDRGELESDSLNQQIQACTRGLSGLTGSGQYQDVAACH